MPEEIHPGVYLEEVSFRARSIEGVDTSTAGFVGVTEIGPDEPLEVTTLAGFERSYGSGSGVMWHAARAFFDQGGRRLVVQRVDEGGHVCGLEALEQIPDVAIVAAPGCGGEATVHALVEHAERMQYRIAVLDSDAGQTPAGVSALREGLDSSYAALYYPWVTVYDAVTGTEVKVPPSGFVAGVYARSDLEHGVHEAPAGNPLVGAVGLERMLSDPESDTLSRSGVNCLRTFTQGEVRVWGARTTSSDPNWQYVNLRRYFAYLEDSIDRGTRWTVFEPYDEPLWERFRCAISEFLLEEFRSGALAGGKPEDAFFVRCDRTTMTQDDLDNGRLVCTVGVAAARPAEFVIIRIGRWTADHGSACGHG